MIVFIGLVTNDFISNRPLLVISRIAPSVPRFIQNTSAALTVPSFRRLPLFISMSDTFVPGTIEPLAVLQNRFRLCSICSNRHVTAAFFSFPCISSCSFFAVYGGKKYVPRERFTQAASVLNISQPAISCQALYCFFSVFFLLFFLFFYSSYASLRLFSPF